MGFTISLHNIQTPSDCVLLSSSLIGSCRMFSRHTGVVTMTQVRQLCLFQPQPLLLHYSPLHKFLDLPRFPLTTVREGFILPICDPCKLHFTATNTAKIISYMPVMATRKLSDTTLKMNSATSQFRNDIKPTFHLVQICKLVIVCFSYLFVHTHQFQNSTCRLLQIC